jgi:hypothetical protein
MMTFKVYASVLFLICLGGQCNAQVVDRTEERAKQKTNQRVDQKIENGIDSGLDAIEGLFKKKKPKEENEITSTETLELDPSSDGEPGDNAISDALLKMMGGGADVKVSDAYHFDHNVEMTMSSYDKKGKLESENDIIIYINDNEPYTAMNGSAEGHSALIIFDLENNQMISLMDNNEQKIGIAMGFDPSAFDELEAENPSESEMPIFSATGQKKKISGFSCSEYKIENVEGQEDMEMHFWMTSEADLNWMSAFMSMAQSNKQINAKSAMPSSYPEGAMIEMTAISLKSGEKTVTTVKKINENQKSKFSTEGFTFMNVGGR